jgi:hypothetical protein
LRVGFGVGFGVGLGVGLAVGTAVGLAVGLAVGRAVDLAVGTGPLSRPPTSGGGATVPGGGWDLDSTGAASVVPKSGVPDKAAMPTGMMTPTTTARCTIVARAQKRRDLSGTTRRILE